MNRFLNLFIIVAIFPLSVPAQNANTNKLAFEEGGSTGVDDEYAIMPYNRLLKSAGKVISWGDSALENHALDISLLPDKKNLVIEDRYGIVIMNIKTKAIVANWRFEEIPAWRDLMSTYAGITSFTFDNSSYIAWGASGRDSGQSALMIAKWDGEKIIIQNCVVIDAITPASNSLPNQVLSNTENGVLYLYVVLNGNNQLLKMRFEDRAVIWTAPTGVAPYAVTIVDNKAYVTNWAGPQLTDSSKENAGTPWGSAYTDPVTGATRLGSLSVINISSGKPLNELLLGLHPNAITKSTNSRFLYIANANSDDVSVIDLKKGTVVGAIETGLFNSEYHYIGSSPDALALDPSGTVLYVANAMDNAIAVIQLGATYSSTGIGDTKILGYIPTEAYPSGIVVKDQQLYVTNLEARGARILSANSALKQADGSPVNGYTIHKELASVSIIAIPEQQKLDAYTKSVKVFNLFNRTTIAWGSPRTNLPPVPLPERMGEPSLFKHVIYIIKENKTYDQVFGDLQTGRGDPKLCIFGDSITPNQHKLAADFCLLDNYYASGKSSAEGHQWVDGGMVSDYVERNVRAWFRSYPHRQEDALVYNKNGFIWNNALDHGKTVRVFGEACLTHYNKKMNWADIYQKYEQKEPIERFNSSTIARLRPVISPLYPDCDNINFTDQLRADVFIDEWKKYEQLNNLPDLLVLSLPNDHTAGLSPNFPAPRAMVADNDLALGRIIETITHSKYWDSTVVFVTEDDSQSGWDHISSYRTTGQVISAYSRLNKTIHTNYNQTSMLRTIEQILGIPPMNVIDATALPMFECFSNTKQPYQYQLLPNHIQLNEMNKPLAQLTGRAKYYARISAAKAYKDLDGGDDKLMNRILWFSAKGTELSF